MQTQSDIDKVVLTGMLETLVLIQKSRPPTDVLSGRNYNITAKLMLETLSFFYANVIIGGPAKMLESLDKDT